MAESLAIVVPTLDRVENMKTILRLFPSALVTVNESNAHLFRKAVPGGQLLPHPDLRLIETRNWILDNVQADAIVMFNDDVKSLVRILPPKRTVRDATLIAAVVENTHRIAADLGAGLFCWQLSKNESLLRPEVRPFRAVVPASAHALGIRGPARARRFDVRLRGCADVDFTLQGLRDDRFIVCDGRWSFDCGRMSSGKGGQTGELSLSESAEARRLLKKRWGAFLRRSEAKKLSATENWTDFAIKVRRKHPLALN